MERAARWTRVVHCGPVLHLSFDIVLGGSMGPSIEQTFCLCNSALYMESIVYLLYCIVCVLYIGFVQWSCILYHIYSTLSMLPSTWCKYCVYCTCVLYTTVYIVHHDGVVGARVTEEASRQCSVGVVQDGCPSPNRA